MKKLSYLWTLLLALMVGVSFVSCDDDDEGDVGVPKEEFYKLKYCSTVVYMVPRA